MAFTGSPTGSTQYNKQTGVTQGGVYGGEVFADLHVARYSYTHAAGAGVGEINLINLPPGPLIIFPDLCRDVTSAFVSTATMDIGHRANTTPAGAVIPAAGAAFAADVVRTGAVDAAWPLPADGDFDINNALQLTIFATVEVANIEDADTIAGFVVWAGGALG